MHLMPLRLCPHNARFADSSRVMAEPLSVSLIALIYVYVLKAPPHNACIHLELEARMRCGVDFGGPTIHFREALHAFNHSKFILTRKKKLCKDDYQAQLVCSHILEVGIWFSYVYILNVCEGEL